jgi:hypothetical protein
MQTPNDNPSETSPPKSARQENLLVSFAFNLILPIMLLTKGPDWFGVSAQWSLVIALSFPLGYGLVDAFRKKRFNAISALGFVSVLIKGSIGLLQLSKDWVAINEAALPLIIGLAVLLTLRTSRPLVNLFLYNPQVFNVARIEAALEARGTRPSFQKLLRICTAWLAASFLLSAILNYAVAKAFIKTEPSVDLEQFNRELGAMQGWSYLFIVLPSMVVTAYALYLLVNGIKRLTGYSFEEAMNLPQDAPAKGKEKKSG